MTPTTILLCGCSADESSEEERGSSHMSFSPLGPFFPHYAKKCPFPIPHHSRVPVKSLTPSSISEGAQGLLISLVVTCLSPFAQISTHFATIAVSYQLLPPLKFPSPSKTVLCLPPLRHSAYCHCPWAFVMILFTLTQILSSRQQGPALSEL